MKLIITGLENFNIPVQGDHKIIKPQGDIRFCIGCFGCWIKTPGECVTHDGYERIGVDLSKCTELILVSRCHYGSVSPFVKTAQDRSISYLSPDFVFYKGEMHHKRRYSNKISLSAYFYGDDITEAEKETARELMEANADNYDGQVEGILFYKSEKELEEITL